MKLSVHTRWHFDAIAKNDISMYEEYNKIRFAHHNQTLQIRSI